MLRRALLAASASDRLRQAVVAAPVTRDIVARFVAGHTADEALDAASRLRADGLLVSLDYLGEDTTDPEQAAAVTQEYVGLLDRLAGRGLAAGGRAEVSVKATAVGLDLPGGEQTAAENLARICAAARNAGTTVTLDAEHQANISLERGLLAELREDFPDLGGVVQSYLRRSPPDCAGLAGPGSRIRLCKGAYRAGEDVAFVARSEIDRSYARCLRVLMNGAGYPMVATHDPRLIEITGALALGAGRDSSSFEYQMLYGIRPAEQARLAAAGAQVRVYLPYGDDWYAYMVRRLAERPANVGFFLRSLRSRS